MKLALFVLNLNWKTHMYGSIDKKQMTCRISWVILFCFCDITFLLSQEQGKFVSKKLENIAFRLSSQYQADCSVKQRILT
jgi:hypothetical protein